MRISQQIGWSQEAKLLYEIQREIDYVYNATWIAAGNTTTTTTTVIVNSVQIGSQVWTSENFTGETYLNGDPISFAADSSEWYTLTTAETGAWCYYNFDISNASYGKLYNWYAATDIRGIGYNGWHFATTTDWNNLKTFLSSDALSIKESGTTHWDTDNGTNTYGFNALGNGFVADDGTSDQLKLLALFWSADDIDPGQAYAFYIEDSSGIIDPFLYPKLYGMALRFVKN
jgi:uncharacterized protein (TIGR02145 family)